MSITRHDWSLQRKGMIDQERHAERVRDAIRKNLGSIVSNESIILSDGKRTVKVPIKSLDEYKFRFDHNKRKHVGQGDGKSNVGDVIAREGDGRSQPGRGNKAGRDGGGEYYEADVQIDEIAKLIFEDLRLPFLEDKAKQSIAAPQTRFNEIRKTGVMSNLDKRRMILENIKRNAREAHKLNEQEHARHQAEQVNANNSMNVSGEASEKNEPEADDRQLLKHKPRFANVKREDLRFKSWEEETRYESNAVVIAIMDVSGCLTAGHLIEMADGSFKDVAEIEIGDKVACVDLMERRKTASSVIDVFTKQVPRTFIVEAEDATLRMTGEHKLFIFDEDRNEILERQASELREGDKLILVNSWGQGATESASSSLTETQSYLLGVLLGDGHLRMPNKAGTYGTYLSISDENLARLEHYRNLFVEAWGVRGIIKLKRSEHTRQRLNVNSTSLVRKLAADYPMLVARSRQRYIEQSIYCQSSSVRAAFLRGLFDAEGTLAHHAVMLTTSSGRLAKQVKHLLSFWNIRARITSFVQSEHRFGDKSIASGVHFRVSINAKDAIRFSEHISFACRDKQAKLIRLVARQQVGIDAMRSRYILPFDWRTRFNHLCQTSRVSSYYKNSRSALSHQQLTIIKHDRQASSADVETIEQAIGNQLLISKVKRVETCDEIVKVYDFEVAEHHNYIVDGMLSHNSMTEFKKYIARSFYFWMVRFLRTKYDNVKIRFISHHTEAREVTEEQFFTQGESGGTVVSSAYELALQIIKKDYNPRDWNIYPFHFSDGDNYYSDNDDAVKLADELIVTCNLFGYGEISDEETSHYRRASGALLSVFNERLKNKKRFIGVRIDSKEDVYPALQSFFKEKT